MKWFYNLKIAKKLTISFIVVALIAGAVGAVGIENLNKISTLDADLYEQHTAIMPDLVTIGSNYQMERGLLKDLLILKDENKKREKIDKMKALHEELEASIKNLESKVNDSRVTKKLEELSKLVNSFRQLRDKEMDLIAKGQEQQATEIMYGEGAVLADNVDESLVELSGLKANLAKTASDNNALSAKTSTITMIIIIVFGIVIAICLGIFLSRIISRPIKKMVEAADKLALGEININVEIDTKEEIGSLAEAFKRMIENTREQAMAAERIAAGDLTIKVNVKSQNDVLGKKLAEMIEKNNEVLCNISSAAEQVASGSKQISDSSIELSQGATEQASSIEELTASFEEISAQTQLNAQNADKANELAEEVKLNAIQGNKQMQEMLKAIEEINEASGNISKVIKVIDDIAFQTNILALNAAVEAARAGQHGKGFAVVAEEVRNLAERSANAAKETTAMIESTIKKSEGGAKIAIDTASELNEIVNGIENVAKLVNEIAAASNDQATGLSQINDGIIGVSQVVQSNSATSEEGAAASEELSSQAEFLREMVGKFKLRENFRTYNSINGLNPEVIKMINDIVEKNGNIKYSNDTYEEPAATKSKILLSEKEFGKY